MGTDSKAIELKYVQPTTAISLFNQEQQKHRSQKNSQYLSCAQPEANVFYMFHQRNKKPQIYSHKKTESKILHNGPDTQDWLRNAKEPKQRICLSSQGQVYAMKQYLSKQKTGNLSIILYPSNLLLAIILLICTIFRALLTFLCILISKEIIMT